MYCVFLLNRLASASLGWRTPIEVAFGVTPDISMLLIFTWYKPVFYYTDDSVSLEVGRSADILLDFLNLLEMP